MATSSSGADHLSSGGSVDTRGSLNNRLASWYGQSSGIGYLFWIEDLSHN